MARAKKKAFDPWEEYQRIQLTPEQKAEARAELEKAADEAARTGVFEKVLALRGKIHLEYDVDELRKDRR